MCVVKAVDANLLDLLKKATQFVVPIYQRVYSWDLGECDQLWKDIVRAGTSETVGAHFTGSIVYVERTWATSPRPNRPSSSTANSARPR